MLRASNFDTSMKVKTDVKLEMQSISIRIDGIGEVTFLHPRAEELVAKTKKHDGLSTIFGFEKEPSWRLPLDPESTYLRMISSLKADGYPLLATALKERMEHHLNCGVSLEELWGLGLKDFLIQKASEYSYLSADPDDCDCTDSIHIASPFNCNTMQHPRATHFLDSAWPLLYKKLNSQLNQRFLACQ